MTDFALTRFFGFRRQLAEAGRQTGWIRNAWGLSLAILAAVAVFDPSQAIPSLRETAASLLSTLPYILFAVLLIAWMKASGAESMIARAFEGREVRMIFFAALLGGLAPFCSCEVVPFIAGLLAVGAPLSAIMAFWLASPLIDPATLIITAGTLGWDFAIGKTVAAVGIGLLGGFGAKALIGAGFFASPLRPDAPGGSCGCGPSIQTGKPVWQFWQEPERRGIFAGQAWQNAIFLIKWLTLAYLLESLLITYVPAETIGTFVGGPGVMPIVLGAAVGAPAYLNGYAAPPLIAGLMEQGMSAGAAMAFMVAGAVSCIPAMAAVFSLVRRPVFAAYVGFGFAGAVLSGLIFAAVLQAV